MRGRKKKRPPIQTGNNIEYNQTLTTRPWGNTNHLVTEVSNFGFIAVKKKRAAENKVQKTIEMGTMGKIKHTWTEVGDFRLMVDSAPCDPGWLEVNTVTDCQQAAHILQLDYVWVRK